MFHVGFRLGNETGFSAIGIAVIDPSSLDLTHRLAKEFDGVIHWARDTETFQSILKSFIRLDLESASPPELPEGWKPAITIFAANGDRA